MTKLYWKDLKSFFSNWIYYVITKNSKAVFQERNNAIKKDPIEAVDFTLRNVQYILNFLPNKDINYLQDKNLLEIGPGQDFGIALILADLGLKEVLLIDPYLIEWQEEYHLLFYKNLLSQAENKFPTIEFTSLKEVIKNNTHQTSKLRYYAFGIENASEIENESIDISISNACFEHFVYPELAIKELARITKKGGIGFHQIDLRDHRDYSQPLEFLTFPDSVFNKIKKMTDAWYGNRLRYTEYNEIFEQFGFSVDFKPDSFAEEVYLNSILKKAIQKYQKMPKESVGTLGGRFFIKKEVS
jgi:SAM-dependent methyltransferase